MGKRILVAVIFVPLIFLVIFWASPQWPVILPVAISAISVLAVHEALWSTGFVKHARISGYSLLLAGLLFGRNYGRAVFAPAAGTQQTELEGG